MRAAALAKGLKQQGLADLMGVNLDRVKSIFSGKVKKLDPQEVLALEEKIHLRPDYLLRGDGPMFKSEPEQKVMDKLRRASIAVASLPMPDWVKRLAQEWSFAIDRADSRRLVELATMTATPRAEEERNTYAAIAFDSELLQAVTSAALTEIQTQQRTMSPDKVAELVVLLYEASQADKRVNPTIVKRLVRLGS